MKGFLFDTHVHTKESSSCGKVSAADIVRRYKSLGYNGIIVTDHVHAAQFSKHGSSYEEQAEKYLCGYKAAKAFEDENFKVILGMEIRFLKNDNDYLFYGFDESFVFSRDLAHIESLEAFRPVVEGNNLIIIQAHPFRHNMTIIEQSLVDGIEVYTATVTIIRATTLPIAGQKNILCPCFQAPIFTAMFPWSLEEFILMNMSPIQKKLPRRFVRANIH